METTLGAIDVWINNAMTTVLAPFRQMSEEEFRRVTEVTYLGYVNGTRAALEVAIPGIGVIIQAGSALAAFNPLQSAYCGAKAAIRGFTDAVRTELMHEKSHIQLTMVQLPGMNTAQFGWARNKMDQAMQPVPRSISRKSPPRLLQRHPAPGQRAVGRKSTIQSILGGLLPRLLDRLMVKKRGRTVYRSAKVVRPTGRPVHAGARQSSGPRPLTMAHGVKQSPSAPISRVKSPPASG